MRGEENKEKNGGAGKEEKEEEGLEVRDEFSPQ